jgi:hypothetical protein
MSNISQETQDLYTSKKLEFAKLLIQKNYEPAIDLATESNQYTYIHPLSPKHEPR